jgi:serine/threonine protein kinase
MESEADFDILRREGVSESGIHFVSQLLNRDPFSRPSEKQCFQHPWIATVPDVDEYEDDDIMEDTRDALSVIGEAEEELDASQLSIHEEAAYTYAAGADESSSNEALAKKPRIEYIAADIRYPSLPKIESFQDGQIVAETHARRLFGEVTSSALRSSHALGHTGSWDDGDYDAEGFASSGESVSDERSVYSIISLPEHPFGGTAPSLMGTENLVRRLNMNSSLPLFPAQTAFINQISTRQTNPGQLTVPTELAKAGSTPREVIPPTSSGNETTPRAPKLSRRIELELPETASERSDSSAPASRRQSTQPPETPAEADYDVDFATTLDAQTGQAILEQLRSAEEEPSDPIVHEQPDAPGIPTHMPVTEFTKPPKLLGKLRSLPGSMFDLNIRLENRMTSWGRGPDATIRHPDNMDVRIPAYALEITFWAPGLERRIAEGEDWTQVPGVMAVLSTKTRKCIWVNDTELRKGGPEGLQFGKLYTGDIITIYKHKDNGEFLRLRCEFYHGESAQPRPTHEAGFVVRQALVGKPDSANRSSGRPNRMKEAE